MSHEKLSVAAILRRNNQGILKRTNSVELYESELTFMLPTTCGMIIVVGAAYKHDELIIQQVIKELEKEIIKAQLDFYKNNRAGCAFAAYAARDPETYGWFSRVIPPETTAIDREIKSAIDATEVTTLSLIFPEVNSLASLIGLLKTFQQCDYIFLEQNVIFEGFRCLGFRVKVGNLLSWVSGFGNFDSLPPTRRTPYTEITFRVKSRPNYKKVMKQTPEHIIHLADLYMRGIADTIFKKMWHSSLKRTAQLIGHKPDLRSAAKTTYILPEGVPF